MIKWNRFFRGIVMNEEIKRLEEMKSTIESFMDALAKYYKNNLTREVVFSGMILKKSLDIIDSAENALKKYNITVQISLLRLLCDNCLAIQSVKELGLKTVMDMIQNNERVNNYMVTEEQNMSDGYLKRLVDETYPGFGKVYKFACDSVHFSKQAMATTFQKDKNGNIIPHVEVGNKELKESLVSNNNSLITVAKIILDMLKNVCIGKEQK